MAKNNPVIEVYKGITIRRSNVYKQRFSATKYKMLILESERTGLPISKILALSSKPCERCSNTGVIVYNNQDEQFSIQRGILYNNMPESNGASIISQHHAKKQ